MAVTVRDIAQAAGVSISTVSRALSAPHMVSDRTRSKVISVAQELGYRPNKAARVLITGRTGNIGLVVPDIENPFFASVTKGVQSRARKAGFAVFIADSDEDASVEGELVQNLAAQVDGVVFCSPRTSEAEIRALAELTPLVLVNREISGLPSITVDNADGIRQVVLHLRALGHRHIAYAGGPASSWSEQQRHAALERTVDNLGDVEVTWLGGFRPFYSGGFAAADLALASNATAVIAYNDMVAVGILGRLHQRGLDVPDALNVVGFDNVSVATLVSPPLTTVGLPLAKIGRAAVDLLLAVVAGNAGDVATRQLPLELIVRESTAPTNATIRASS
jgi:DNA-binding LacI/PurR family transcriptional regulator